MDDQRIDLLLREAGEDFRARHTEPVGAHVTRTQPARTRWLIPAGVAAAAAALVLGLALTLPEGTTRTTPGSATSVALGVGQVVAVELSPTWVAVVGRDLTPTASQDRIELRRRDDLGRVAATVTSSYASGVLFCPALDGDALLWTDVQAGSLPVGTRRPWSLWQRDLRTDRDTRLEVGSTGDQAGELPCPVAGQGWAAWRSQGQLSVRDLSSGFTYARPQDALPAAITAWGLVATQKRPGGLDVHLFTGETYGTRTTIASVDGGTDATAAGDRLLVLAQDAAKGADGRVVSTCTLPTCDLQELRRGTASTWPTVGDGFAAWSEAEPVLVRFDGGPVPETVSGLVPDASLSASGGTLAYVVAGFPPTLHLVEVTPPAAGSR